MKQQRIQPPLRMALSLALIGLLSMTAMAGRKDAGSSRLTGQSVSGHAKRTALARITAAAAPKSVWSRAITGSIYVQGTDPVWHGSSDDDPVAATQVLMLDGINFVAGGPGTGLYVSLSCFYASESETPVDVLSSIGDFQAIDSECSDAVTIVNPTHPAMAGLTSADLSDW